MNDKTIDLERIRQAHARLDVYLAEHPEMLGESSEAEWLEIVKGVIVTKQMFSVKEAAELLEVDEETIRRAIRKKALKAAKIGKDYRISRQDFEAYYRQQGGGSLFGDEAAPDANQADES
ncbi:MAG: helix-turn-helix domain-containing protein [Syntrophobacteraceae bacterium]